MGDIEKKSRKAGDIHRRRRQYDHIVQFTRPTWIHCCYQRVAGNPLQTVAISESTRSNHMAVIVTYIDVSETIAIERSFQYFGRDFIVPRVCLCSPTGYFTKISDYFIHFHSFFASPCGWATANAQAHAPRRGKFFSALFSQRWSGDIKITDSDKRPKWAFRLLCVHVYFKSDCAYTSV